MKIVSVVGARPNFMKIAPFIRAIESYSAVSGNESIEHLLVHTGQHYDDRMSRSFFQALGIPEANINLGIGSGTHAEQVGRTMIEFEKVAQQHAPDWVVVVGDVNATCACSITAKKENLRLAHIEAGLRSGDMSMPEEVNRLVTDRLSDLLLTPDRISNENLLAEGVAPSKIRFVGNIMIDTLEEQRAVAEQIDLPQLIARNRLDDGDTARWDHDESSTFAVVTLHRPSNVDDPAVLSALVEFLVSEVARDMPLIWPIHPRTQQRLLDAGLWPTVEHCQRIELLHPVGYHDMLKLNMHASVMLTDSGGLQEECCVLGTPCLTLRANTERPITLREHGGISALVGNDIERVRSEYRSALESDRNPVRPELWDGQTAPRIVREIIAATPTT